MTRTPEQISRDIRESLNASAPGLSLGLGTPERKIIDSVAEAISESYIENYIVKSNWDIDSLTGMELEGFVAVFGFGRLLGRRATGVVTFSLSSPAQQHIPIPAGSQVFVPETSTTPLIVYMTTAPTILAKGTTSVRAPVECVTAGSIGNVAIDRITGFGNQLGFTGVTNQEPLSGGIDAESDEALRKRFKDTFLRNIAGTEDFYEGVCREHASVSKVHVIGPMLSSQEQLQVTAGKAISQVQDAKYIWPKSDFAVKDIGTELEEYYVRDRDYLFDHTVIPPVVTAEDATKMPNGFVFDLAMDYTPTVSRNDPANGITNKVDIFVSGSDTVEVSEAVVQGWRTFTNTTTSPLYRQNFRDVDDHQIPAAGNVFLQLGCVPIVTFPDVIELENGTVYERGVHYRIQKNVMEVEKGSQRETAGIEWISETRPPLNTRFVVNYSYNRLPEVLDAMFKDSKQITTDPLVHTVDLVTLRINLVVIYMQGYSVESVNSTIEYVISRWFSEQEIGAWIQFSDIEAVVAGVSGVDAVRMTRSTDGSAHWGLEVMRGSGPEGGVMEHRYTNDFQLGPSEQGVFHSLNVTRRSPNTFVV